MATLTPEDLNSLVLEINAEEVKKELVSKYPTKSRPQARQADRRQPGGAGS